MATNGSGSIPPTRRRSVSNYPSSRPSAPRSTSRQRPPSLMQRASSMHSGSARERPMTSRHNSSVNSSVSGLQLGSQSSNQSNNTLRPQPRSLAQPTPPPGEYPFNSVEYLSKGRQLLNSATPWKSGASQVRPQPKNSEGPNTYSHRAMAALAGTSDPGGVRQGFERMANDLQGNDSLRLNKHTEGGVNGTMYFGASGPAIGTGAKVGPFGSVGATYSQSKDDELKLQRNPQGELNVNGNSTRTRKGALEVGGGAGVAIEAAQSFGPWADVTATVGVTHDKKQEFALKQGRSPVDAMMDFPNRKANQAFDNPNWTQQSQSSAARPTGQLEARAIASGFLQTTSNAESRPAYSYLMGGVSAAVGADDLRHPRKTAYGNAGPFAMTYFNATTTASDEFVNQAQGEAKLAKPAWTYAPKNKTPLAPGEIPQQKYYGSNFNSGARDESHIKELDKRWGPGKKDLAIRQMRQTFSPDLPQRSMSFRNVPHPSSENGDHMLKGTATLRAEAGHSGKMPFLAHERYGSAEVSHERDLFMLRKQDYRPPSGPRKLQKPQPNVAMKPAHTPVPEQRPFLPPLEPIAPLNIPMPPSTNSGSQASGRQPPSMPYHSSPITRRNSEANSSLRSSGKINNSSNTGPIHPSSGLSQANSRASSERTGLTRTRSTSSNAGAPLQRQHSTLHGRRQ